MYYNYKLPFRKLGFYISTNFEIDSNIMGKIIVINKEDFDQFKEELLVEVKAIFETNIKKTKWIRSKNVRKCSVFRIQHFRLCV